MIAKPPGIIAWLLLAAVIALCGFLLFNSAADTGTVRNKPASISRGSSSSARIASSGVSRATSSAVLAIPEAPSASGSALAEGLVLSLIGADGTLDRRVARMAAFTVPVGEPPSPFLPAGPFTATLDGEFALPLWTKAKLTVEYTGAVQVDVDNLRVIDASSPAGSASSAAMRINRSGTRLRISYRSPDHAEARLRLLWESDEFVREPMPARSLRHRPGDALLHAGMQRRQGRALWEEQRCDACHGSGEVAAPILSQLGQRMSREWIAQWILDPQAIRPGAQMPALLTHLPRDQQLQAAADLAAFLTQDTAPAPHKPRDETLVADGAHRFTHYGCAACHGGDEPTVSLRHA